MKIIHFSKKAQSVLEYILMLAAVVSTIVIVFSPKGFITTKTATSLNSSLECLRSMAMCVKYDANGNPEPPVCNNGCCESGEPTSCPQDCQGCGGTGAQINANCGDRICEGSETCSSCSPDCGTCGGPSCPDGTCDTATESCTTCPADCGICPAVCGDGKCGVGENCNGCPDCACTGSGICMSSGICCNPGTCAGKCGTAVDVGCGKIVDCSASCNVGQKCFNGSCCTPRECATRECGSLDDNCGGTLQCDCSSPYQCCDDSSQCAVGQCVCFAFQCLPGWCGEHADNCGTTGTCPPCTPPQICDSNGICCDPPVCPPGECGSVSNGCGGTVQCSCPNPSPQEYCVPPAGPGMGTCCTPTITASEPTCAKPPPKAIGDNCGSINNSETCYQTVNCGSCGSLTACDPVTHKCVTTCGTAGRTACEPAFGENCATCPSDCVCPNTTGNRQTCGGGGVPGTCGCVNSCPAGNCNVYTNCSTGGTQTCSGNCIAPLTCDPTTMGCCLNSCADLPQGTCSNTPYPKCGGGVLNCGCSGGTCQGNGTCCYNSTCPTLPLGQCVSSLPVCGGGNLYCDTCDHNGGYFCFPSTGACECLVDGYKSLDGAYCSRVCPPCFPPGSCTVYIGDCPGFSNCDLATGVCSACCTGPWQACWTLGLCGNDPACIAMFTPPCDACKVACAADKAVIGDTKCSIPAGENCKISPADCTCGRYGPGSTCKNVYPNCSSFDANNPCWKCCDASGVCRN